MHRNFFKKKRKVNVKNYEKHIDTAVKSSLQKYLGCSRANRQNPAYWSGIHKKNGNVVFTSSSPLFRIDFPPQQHRQSRTHTHTASRTHCVHSLQVEMPSLQQISLKDCTTSQTVTDIGHGMTAGSDILHKHSINSLLAEQNDIVVNRGLASPIEGETISFPDLFGSNAIANGNNASATAHNNTNGSSNTTTSNNMRSHQFLNVHQNMLACSGLFAKSNIQQPCNNTINGGGANCIGSSGIGGGSGCTSTAAAAASAATTTTSNNFHHQSSIMSPNSGSSSSNSNFMQSAKTFDNNFQFDMTNTSSNTLKVLQRNLSFECNSPINSPSTPSSYGARNNLSPLFNNGFNNFDSSLLSSSSSFSNSTNLSNSPTDYNDNLLSSLENQNFMNQMNYLTLNEPQSQQFGCSGSSGSASPLSPTDFDLVRMQNLQSLNTLHLLQQSQQLNSLGGLSNLDPLTLNQLLQSCNLTNQYRASLQMAAAASVAAAAVAKSPTTPQTSDLRLDHVAKFYRSSAALNEAKCTWSGVLPPRSHRNMTYSPKVFLGGIPWDISEQSLISIFKQFGSIKVEWPGKEQQTSQPRGYVYIIFESERQVKSLLQACCQSEYSSSSGSIPSTVSSGSGNYYFKISSKKIKSKEVEVIPWIIADSNYVKSTSQKLDPTKTVFVGALHGKLTAEGLAKIMNDLFDGVIYAGLDTDKYKYPIGSGRVTFNNSRSYMRAVSAAFVEIKSSKFTKKVQVDPYLEDSLCSKCGVQHGPYYCRELVCFRYFCRTCWQVWHHSSDMSIRNHKPLTRNPKSTQIIGVGPQSSNGSNGGNNSDTPLMSPTAPQSMRARIPFMKRQ